MSTKPLTAVDHAFARKALWTKPYYGVQHLNNAPHRTQITVVDRGSFAEVYMLDRDSYRAFTPVKEAHCATAAEARTIGEGWVPGEYEPV